MSPLVRRQAGVLLGLLTVANLFGYAARNAFLAAYDDIRQVYGVDNSQIGLLSSVFIAGQAIATLPIGWLGDRRSRKWMLIIGVLLAGLCSVLSALSVGWYGLVGLRFWVGVGTAAIVPIANALLADVFDGPHKASRIAIFNLGLFVGGAVGVVGGAQAGFPFVLYVLGGPTIALAMVLMVVTFPPQAPVAARDTGASGGRGISGARVVGGVVGVGVGFPREVARLIAAVWRCRAMPWMLGAATTMAFAAGGITAWLVEFLKVEKRMTEQGATTLLMIAMVGGLAGVIVGGRISDAWLRRDPAGRPKTVVASMALTAPLLGLCIWAEGPALYVVATMALFCMSWYHAPLAATVDDVVPTELSVGAQAVTIFFMHLFGTALSPWVLGEVSDVYDLATAMWVAVAVIPVACILMAKTARMVGVSGRPSL